MPIRAQLKLKDKTVKRDRSNLSVQQKQAGIISHLDSVSLPSFREHSSRHEIIKDQLGPKKIRATLPKK